MNLDKIGKFIAKCRKENALTQKQLAENLNVSEKTVSKWECGLGLPEVSTMLDLCAELGINIIDLLKAEDSSNTWYRFIRVGGTKLDDGDIVKSSRKSKVVTDLSKEKISKIQDIGEKADDAVFKVVIAGFNITEGNYMYRASLHISDDTGVMDASICDNGDIAAKRLIRRMDVGQVYLFKGSVVFPKCLQEKKFLIVEEMQLIDEGL
ncbi:MAG: helix-turn-helix transcriptional regulator [Bacilli bacterium]|nr:helix-turn-helix transcriptional regulator [Bacilli bacterium]